MYTFLDIRSGLYLLKKNHDKRALSPSTLVHPDAQCKMIERYEMSVFTRSPRVVNIDHTPIKIPEAKRRDTSKPIDVHGAWIRYYRAYSRTQHFLLAWKRDLTHWYGRLPECSFHSCYLDTFHAPSGTRTMMPERRSVTAWKSASRRYRECAKWRAMTDYKPLSSEREKCSSHFEMRL